MRDVAEVRRIGKLTSRVQALMEAVVGSHHGGVVTVHVDPMVGEGVRAVIELRFVARIHVDTFGITDVEDVIGMEAGRVTARAGRRFARDLRAIAVDLERGIDEYEERSRG